ncbi:hypothetical protein N0B16_07575 [Chryseobacterium sp. GMJ5]|uniref:Uncharacterized protein n=1 Tax=Chryseobacterium gilvum TaxID=2976534 RepID=A0ABT2VWB1_9FLAO|nr:hypothetical protein [Chryseobacterium gilvum]MCU7614293.1 hypothetical protein [Chryseobacterium gilvum]
MKNYLLISITILAALTTGFLFGRYTSDSGRYIFKYNGVESSLFDTKNGDVYLYQGEEMVVINYKNIHNEIKKK